MKISHIALSALLISGIAFADNYLCERTDGTIVPTYSFEAESRTIYLSPSNSTEEIQAKIDSVGRHLHEGGGITFQFQDGTYTLSNTLYICGFYGGGSISINGNTADAGVEELHTSQSVHLNGSTLSGNVFYLEGNQCYVHIRNVKVTVPDASNKCGVEVRNSNFVRVWNSYFVGAGKLNSNAGVQFYRGCTGHVQYTYLSNLKYGIISKLGTSVCSNSNASTGTDPDYGLHVSDGGIIAKKNSQPDGYIQDEYVRYGGVIR